MKCRNCGTEFDEGIFCPECGTKVVESDNESENISQVIEESDEEEMPVKTVSPQDGRANEVIEKEDTDRTPWYLSIWFIVLIFVITFPIMSGIPGIVLLILRIVKGKKNKK